MVILFWKGFSLFFTNFISITMDYSQKLHEVTPHTLMFHTDNSNAGAIIFPHFIVAIDPTMNPPDSRGFRTEMEKKYNKPMKFLLITH